MSQRFIRDFNVKQEAKDNTNLPIRGIVTRALPEEDAVMISTALAAGSMKYPVGHPYIGSNSWIRVMPEPGTETLTLERGDSASDVAIGYISNSMIKKLRQAKAGNLLMRVLNPGEIELMSSGRAYLYLGDGGDIEMRGGTIRTDLLQTEQEHSSLAPTYIRRLHLNEPSALKHTERFGVVKRPDQSKPNSFQKYIRLTNREFAMEYSRWLNTKTDIPLVSIQEGHVYDEMGQEKKQVSTNRPLRLERILTDKNGAANITYQVDEDLNVNYSNASGTSKEAIFKFGSLVTLDLSSDQYKLTVNKTGTINYGQSWTTTSPKVSIKSADVNFGNNPIYQAIIGTTLVSSILTPMVSVLQTFMQLYSVDPFLTTKTPTTVASANAANVTLASVSSNLNSALSQQVKLSG